MPTNTGWPPMPRVGIYANLPAHLKRFRVTVKRGRNHADYVTVVLAPYEGRACAAAVETCRREFNLPASTCLYAFATEVTP